MPWKPGESGNPKGRPPKNRELATILLRELSKVRNGPNDVRTNGKRLLARLMTEAVLTGKVKIAEGAELVLTVDQWLEAARFIYNHIDGPAKSEHDLNLDGGLLLWDVPVPDKGSEYPSS